MRGKSMQYAVLCYNYESVVGAWSKDKDDAVMVSHGAVMQKFAARGKLGPVARLMPTTTATTVRAGKEAVVLDGPFAETKEQLLGFYIFDCDSLEEVIEAAKNLLEETGALEIRPLKVYFPAPAGK
jgi:hypothetical protein